MGIWDVEPEPVGYCSNHVSSVLALVMDAANTTEVCVLFLVSAVVSLCASMSPRRQA